MTTINQMPSDARVWVYQSNTLLTDAEVNEITAQGKAFIESWTAHGAAFIIISVDEQQALASGCSIDKSLAFIKSLEQRYNLKLLDRMQVAYRKEQTIEVCALSEFEKLAGAGAVTPQTIVFNNMITTKSDFDSNWEIPLQESWQKRVLN